MLNNSEKKKGIVVAIKANYLLVDIEGENFKPIRLLCTCRTKLKFHGDYISVGDFVLVESIDFDNHTAAVCFLHARKSFLTRPSVANVTDIFIIISVMQPRFDPDQASRFLIKAEQTGQNVILVLTKTDLIDSVEAKQYVDRLGKWGYKPFLVSIKNKTGISLLLEKLEHTKLGVFCGPSGTGKSSLLNYFLPEAFIPVGELSKKLKRGKHTTRNVELFSLGKGSLLADTPGFNRPDLTFESKSLSFLFPELRIQLVNNKKCKFRNCLHLKEPGCCVDKNWERYSYYRKYLLEKN